MLIRSWLAILIFSTMLTACGNAPSLPVDASNMPQPSSPPTIVGEITQLDHGMLVEQQPGATIGNKIVFTLNDATRVAARVGDALEPKTVADLAEGQRVEVCTGEVRYGGTPQADALTVVVIND